MITPSIFYLIDTQDMSVLFGHQNKHIVVSLGSGILGSQVCFTSDLVAVHTILNFVNHPGQMGIQGIAPLKGSSGLKHQVRSPGSFILSERPQIVEKINLIKTRRPAVSYMQGQPPTEAFMESHANINDDLGTPYVAKSYVTWDNTSLDLYKQAIVQGNGMIAVTWGNNACWQTGNVLVPDLPSQMVWRHIIYIIGYDDTKKCFEFVNSWSKDWGDAGFGCLPYAYVTNGYLANPTTLVDLPNNYYSLLQKLIGLYKNLISLLTHK